MKTVAELWKAFAASAAVKTPPPVAFAAQKPGPVLSPWGEQASGYFQIRLAEMFLRNKRELTQEYVPATLFLCEFKYGAQKVRVPFFVSNQLLAGLQAGNRTLDDADVRYRNTRVVGPIPYQGDEVAIFAGLFKISVKDHRKSLFNVFEKLFGASYATGLVPYVQLAEKISDELFASLGMGDMVCVLAERNVVGTAKDPLGSGYLALLNCKAGTVDTTALLVLDGSLQLLVDGVPKPFDACDYCLLHVETSETRDDITTLSFHKLWRDAQAKLLRGQVTEARAALLECQAALLASDDLTEDHKYKLIAFYKAAFLKDQQRFAEPAAADVERHAVRSGTRGGGAPDAGLEVAQLVSLRDRQPQLEESLVDIQALFRSPPVVENMDSLRRGLADEKAWEKAVRDFLAGSKPAAMRPAASELAQVLTESLLR